MFWSYAEAMKADLEKDKKDIESARHAVKKLYKELDKLNEEVKSAEVCCILGIYYREL